MDNPERIRTILKHCIQKECYGCPLRQNRDCVRSMAFTANQTIVSLEKSVKELEKRNAELENRNAELENRNAELEKRNAELENRNAELENLIVEDFEDE